jgi:hypothetical protein
MLRLEVSEDFRALGRREEEPDQGERESRTAHIAYSTL